MAKELIRGIFPQIDRYFPFHGSKILSVLLTFYKHLLLWDFFSFGICIPSMSTSPSDNFIGKLHSNVKVVFFCDPIRNITYHNLVLIERIEKVSKSSMDPNCGFKRKHESSVYNDTFVFKPWISNRLKLSLDLYFNS